MPHCMRGNLLKEGDLVLVPAIVVSVSPGDDYCNVTVKTAHTMPPYPDSPTSVTLNTKQVALAGVEESELFPASVVPADAPEALEADPAA